MLAALKNWTTQLRERARSDAGSVPLATGGAEQSAQVRALHARRACSIAHVGAEFRNPQPLSPAENECIMQSVLKQIPREHRPEADTACRPVEV